MVQELNGGKQVDKKIVHTWIYRTRKHQLGQGKSYCH